VRRCVLALALAACSGDPSAPGLEFVPEMVRTAAYDSFSPNLATRDGKTLLLPAPGSIPRGFSPFHYGAGPEEAARAGRELHNPLPASADVLARGQRVFAAFCSHCHGQQGQADGTVQPSFPAPPSLLANHARQLADGQIFHVLSRGQGLMPALAAQLRPSDRWSAVHHVRRLQAGGTP
jgi:mono/diheme cytochrome c family protein